MLKGKGRKRRKISREEKLENARHRALQKLGEEEAADVLAVFQKASDAGDKEQADGIFMTLFFRKIKGLTGVYFKNIGHYLMLKNPQ